MLHDPATAFDSGRKEVWLGGVDPERESPRIRDANVIAKRVRDISQSDSSSDDNHLKADISRKGEAHYCREKFIGRVGDRRARVGENVKRKGRLPEVELALVRPKPAKHTTNLGGGVGAQRPVSSN